MIKITSSKITPTGYLAAEYYRNDKLRRWEDIEQERETLRLEAISQADQLTVKNGHQMRTWSNIPSSYCSKCAREAKIIDIYSRLPTRFLGPAFEQQCDNTESYGSRDRFTWQSDKWEMW